LGRGVRGSLKVSACLDWGNDPGDEITEGVSDPRTARTAAAIAVSLGAVGVEVGSAIGPRLDIMIVMGHPLMAETLAIKGFPK
jgi:hypothetical protein